MKKPQIAVILGSIREGRNGIKVFRWLQEVLPTFDQADYDFVDLKDFNLPMFADAVSPKSREGKHENPEVEKWLERVAAADGYIFVTPEYNHSVSSVLKNAVDYEYKAWNGKPLGLVSYGGAGGGLRAVEHWRQIAAELQMYDVRDQVSIPFVWNAFDEAGHLENEEAHKDGLGRMLKNIVDLTECLKR